MRRGGNWNSLENRSKGSVQVVQSRLLLRRASPDEGAATSGYTDSLTDRGFDWKLRLRVPAEHGPVIDT